jgi:hypothetical protein
MDIAAIGSLLSSLNSATEIAKFIRSGDISIEKAETKLKLAELISTLADVKLEVAEIQQALTDREHRIHQLETDLKTRENLRWREPCYWMDTPSGTEEPYCQACFDSSRLTSRLHTVDDGTYQCRVCDKNFLTPAKRRRNEEDYKRLLAHNATKTF